MNRNFLIILLLIGGCHTTHDGDLGPKIEVELPKAFKDIPLQDKTGLVAAVNDIRISNARSAFNLSLTSIKNHGDEQYLGAFRIKAGALTYQAEIGIVEFDKDFKQFGKEIFLDTGVNPAQDARLIKAGGEIYAFYNGLKPFETWRTMYVAKLKKIANTWQIVNNSPIDLKKDRHEKNWAPFTYSKNGSEIEKLLFSYTLEPHVVYEVTNRERGEVLEFSQCKRPLNWKYGYVSGGTPAILVEDEYLAFFHSQYQDDETGLRWWVMGAYTYAKEPPFCITSISKFPILYNGQYTSAIGPAGFASRRVVFPMGVVASKKDGKEVFYLSVGENDSANKIITIDPVELKKSMIPVTGE